VSTKVFNAFRTYTFDDGTCYLLRDLSISCTSPTYATIRGWALVMVFLYPLGIPAFYFVLLYRARHDLDPEVCLSPGGGGGDGDGDDDDDDDDDGDDDEEEEGGGG
jgi:hypothetical protein